MISFWELPIVWARPAGRNLSKEPSARPSGGPGFASPCIPVNMPSDFYRYKCVIYIYIDIHTWSCSSYIYIYNYLCIWIWIDICLGLYPLDHHEVPFNCQLVTGQLNQNRWRFCRKREHAVRIWRMFRNGDARFIYFLFLHGWVLIHIVVKYILLMGEQFFFIVMYMFCGWVNAQNAGECTLAWALLVYAHCCESTMDAAEDFCLMT